MFLSKCWLLSYIVVLLFLITGSNVYAQKHLSGIISEEENKPVASAVISLFKTVDSSLLKIVVSEDDGSFRFEGLSPTNYYLRISGINYRDTGVIVTADMLTGGDLKIRLATKSKDLEGIVINGSKPLIEHKVDRTVFNVEQSIASIGADALEALQKAPGVIVNGENISMAGKSTVKMMLNDHVLELSGDDLIEFLKSISADDISRIEIITNPPASYDAEGNSGIINIVLKKSSRKGFSGNVRAGYTQNIYASGEAGGSLNYSDDKLNFYSTIHADRGAEAVTESMNIRYPEQWWTKYNTRKIEIAGLNGTLGADYKLTGKTTLGFMYNGGYNAPDFNGHITNPIYNNAGSIDSTIHTDTHTIQHTTSHSINLGLQYLLGSHGKKLTVDADYFSNISTKDRDVYSTTYTPDTTRPTQTKSYAEQQITVYTLKSDLKLPYKFATIMVGGKLSFIENNTPASYYNVANSVYYPDSTNTDHFIYRENTQALYASASREFRKWSYQAGLRGEYTETTGISKTLAQTNTNSYFQIFPTAFLQYKENGDNIFSASYGRRIERPDYWRTNPFKYYSTPYYYQEGNPFLQPAYSNNAEVSHTYKDILTTTLFLHNTTNAIEEITTVSGSSNLIVIQYKNYLTINSYGLTESIAFSKLKWLESNTQVNLYHTDAVSNYPGTAPHTQSYSCNFSTDNTIILNRAKTVMADVGYNYQFPEVVSILKYEAHSGLDVGIKLMTRDKKWTMAVNGTDIFRTEKLRYATTMNGIPINNYGYYDQQGVRVNIAYKFGKNKTELPNHEAGNEDEARRAK